VTLKVVSIFIHT